MFDLNKPASFEKVAETEALIRFADCDPFNHLNNSRYIDYFINAREDHLMKVYKFDMYRYIKERNMGWVVGMNQISYLKPAMLMETVVIQSTIREMNEKDLLVEMTMFDKEKRKLKSLLWTRFYHIDFATMRSAPHDEEMMKQFKLLENPLENINSFEQRLAQLRVPMA
jgi:thioesterase-3